MSSLAAFIQEILNDPNYGKGSDYVESLESRIKTLNRAQLHGFYKHLIKMSENANSTIWKEANNELITLVEKFVVADKLLAAEEKRIEDEITAKQLKKQKYDEGKVIEGKRMRAHVKSKARKTAEDEVFERERKREAAEKVEIMEKEPAAAKRRLLYGLLGVFLLLLVIVITSLAAKNQPVVVAVVIVMAIVLSLGLFYKAYKVGQIVPITITKAELDEQIEQRTEELTAAVMADLAEKERQFQAMDEEDKEDRRQRRNERRRLRQEALASFEDLDSDGESLALEVSQELEQDSSVTKRSVWTVSLLQVGFDGLLSLKPLLSPGADLNLYVRLSHSAGVAAVCSDTQWKVEQDSAIWRPASAEKPLLSVLVDEVRTEDVVISLMCVSAPSPRSERSATRMDGRSDPVPLGCASVRLKALLESKEETMHISLSLQRNNVEVPVAVHGLLRWENKAIAEDGSSKS